LKKLFKACSLDEGETDEGDVGFSLPPSTSFSATSNMTVNALPIDQIKVLVEACDLLDPGENASATLNYDAVRQMIPNVGARVGPTLPPSADDADLGTTHHKWQNDKEDELDSESEDGPSLGGVNARKSIYTKDQVKALAEQREKELSFAAGKGPAPISQMGSNSGREEWMTTPGEHDFLSSVTTIKAQTKSRAFKNERVRGQSVQETALQSSVSPAVQAEMEAIAREHAAARGPSLIELHREKKSKEREESRGKGNWKWNREGDLDKGRRVDKDALHMVLGGAADNLKDKFQGSLSKSFM